MLRKAAPGSFGFPSDDEIQRAFGAYVSAVGKVAHAWNYLHEKLGQLFVYIIDADRTIALAVWYAPDSDRAKQGMLKAAITASPPNRWPPRLPKARDDLLWLMDRVIDLGDARNNAIHAPCSAVTGPDGTEMMASFLSGHARAKKLTGKQVLVEFDWLERWTEELTRFTQRAETSIACVEYPWPDRPVKPDRRPKKVLLAPHHQPQNE